MDNKPEIVKYAGPLAGWGVAVKEGSIVAVFIGYAARERAEDYCRSINGRGVVPVAALSKMDMIGAPNLPPDQAVPALLAAVDLPRGIRRSLLEDAGIDASEEV